MKESWEGVLEVVEDKFTSYSSVGEKGIGKLGNL